MMVIRLLPALALVAGNVTVTKGSALVAAFGLNDSTQSGSSSLSVAKSVFVREGATLILGCEPIFFTCLDEPGAMTGPGTLTSNGTVSGSILGTHALAIVVHASSVGGNLQMIGGGYGNSCTPPTPSPSSARRASFRRCERYPCVSFEHRSPSSELPRRSFGHHHPRPLTHLTWPTTNWPQRVLAIATSCGRTHVPPRLAP